MHTDNDSKKKQTTIFIIMQNKINRNVWPDFVMISCRWCRHAVKITRQEIRSEDLGEKRNSSTVVINGTCVWNTGWCFYLSSKIKDWPPSTSFLDVFARWPYIGHLNPLELITCCFFGLRLILISLVLQLPKWHSRTFFWHLLRDVHCSVPCTCGQGSFYTSCKKVLKKKFKSIIKCFFVFSKL